MHRLSLRAWLRPSSLALCAAACAALLLGQAATRVDAGATSSLDQVRLDRHAALAGEGLALDGRLGADRDVSARWAVYLSTDDPVTRDDRRLGSWHTESLAAGETRAISTLVTVPADLAPGSYRLGVIAELGADTLIAVDPTPLSVGDAANLTGELSVARTSAQAGEALDVVLQLRNGGLRPATGSACRVYLSRNDAITRYDLEIGRFALSGLGAGATRREALRAAIPATAGVGEWYVGALLDADDQVTETSEDDNACAAPRQLTVSAGPGVDLVAEALAPATRAVVAGEELRLSRTLRNDGSVPSGTFSYAVVLSTNQTISSYDPELWRGTVASLAPGAASATTVTVRVPAGTQPGTYWVGVRVDPDGALGEAQTANNALAAAQTVEVRAAAGGRAELTASGVAPRYRTIRPGDDLPVERRIRNRGAGDAPPFSYVVVLSRDARISTADRELYRFRFPSGLAAGESRDSGASVRIPSDVRPGEYYLGVIADVDGEVLEDDEDDGVAAAADFVRVDRGVEVRRFDPARAHVSDGDTLRIESRSYRLLGMDTPEKASPTFTGDQEPHASRASAQTRAFLNGARELALHVAETDQYGRTLAQAFVDGRSLAKLMIEAEHAYETIRVFGDAGFRELADELIDAQRGHYPPFERPWLWRWSHTR